MYVIPYKRDASLPLRAVIRKVVQNGSNFARFIYSPRAFQRAIARKIWIRIAQNRGVLLLCETGNDTTSYKHVLSANGQYRDSPIGF
jgi:hypothetical protein